MLIDEFVIAASVGVIDFAFLGVAQGDVAFCRAAEPEHSKILVDGECLFAQNLRKLSARDAPKEIHLPEPVLRHDVALRFGEIFYRGGPNVRNAPLVTFDGDLVPETGQGSAAVDLRQRAVDEPPSTGPKSNNKDGRDPEDNPKNGSQVYSHPFCTKFECRGGRAGVQPKPGKSVRRVRGVKDSCRHGETVPGRYQSYFLLAGGAETAAGLRSADDFCNSLTAVALSSYRAGSFSRLAPILSPFFEMRTFSARLPPSDLRVRSIAGAVNPVSGNFHAERSR